MATPSKSGAFYRIVKQISITQIEREAEMPVRLLVVCPPDMQAEIAARLFGPGASHTLYSDDGILRFFASADSTAGFPNSLAPDDIVIDLNDENASLSSTENYFHAGDLGGWDRVIDRLLEMRQDLWVSLGRRFPPLRCMLSERIVRETALANAEWAMINALPGVIPFVAWLLPTAAIGDMLMLSKNQAMMMYRIAAAHGLAVRDFRARSQELAPLIGSAFGWRAIARELVAVVPGGVGLLARGVIAYAGTAALGKAITVTYQSGKQATSKELFGYYRDALSSARRNTADRLKQIRPPRDVAKLTVHREHRAITAEPLSLCSTTEDILENTAVPITPGQAD